MECPRCKSTRIQRGYNDPRILLRIGGAHELLCNNCGLEFKSFRWAASFNRVAARKKGSDQNRRRAPRYKVHLPVTIRLVDQGANNEPSLSPVVRGHCQTISSLGMALSFVGSHFDRAELEKPGRLLLVVVSLPSGAMEVLVKAITSERVENSEGPASWLVGASIVQISDAARSLLSAYIDKRSQK